MALLSQRLRDGSAHWLAALALLLPVLGASPAGAQDGALPLAVKATYLVKFIPFIEWPAPLAAARGTTVCIEAGDPLGTVLDRAAAAQPLGTPPITLRRVQSGSSAEECRVLYAGNGSDGLAPLLRTVAGRPILTVTDSASMDGPHGIINFVQAGNRIRFEVDLAQAKRSRLGVSSKLLGLALRVKQAP